MELEMGKKGDSKRYSYHLTAGHQSCRQTNQESQSLEENAQHSVIIELPLAQHAIKTFSAVFLIQNCKPPGFNFLTLKNRSSCHGSYCPTVVGKLLCSFGVNPIQRYQLAQMRGQPFQP